jgi:hypothetical protein
VAQLRGTGEADAGPAEVLAGDQQAVISPGRQQGQQMLAGQGEPAGGIGGGRQRPTAQGGIDLPHQPRVAHAAPAHHHAVGAADRQAAQGRLS